MKRSMRRTAALSVAGLLTWMAALGLSVNVLAQHNSVPSGKTGNLDRSVLPHPTPAFNLYRQRDALGR
jgi:hypothetical protein